MPTPERPPIDRLNTSGWARPGDPHCGRVVGPVWKDRGESWACQLPPGHGGGHETRGDENCGGSWWVDDRQIEEAGRAD